MSSLCYFTLNFTFFPPFLVQFVHGKNHKDSLSLSSSSINLALSNLSIFLVSESYTHEKKKRAKVGPLHGVIQDIGGFKKKEDGIGEEIRQKYIFGLEVLRASDLKVLGNILLHPLFGGEKRTELEKKFDEKYFVKLQDRGWYWRAFLPEGEDRDHPACNISTPCGFNLADVNFPKSLVVVVGLDLIQDYWRTLKSYRKEGKM
ncbi:hypothetical protein L2E82_02517 [Cichorium intybus]|uniref:Uncharacterized protein n=1 Tax=Cichorium intybus TaxID=13427 RepID=A0ACB9H1H7_CICIN|nr:hypothetical protein L2E82_02517 [Cichorium intybus]